MAGRDRIAIGASAGGVPALQELVASFDPDLPAAVFVALHMWPSAQSELPAILSRSGPLPSVHPLDGTPVERGHIYVAPPDHHIVIENDAIRLNRGPVVNRHRPSIDVLFRSVAREYSGRAIGVLLTGSDDDGAAGLGAIRGKGGVAIVQDPDESLFPQMPLSALNYGVVDHTFKVAEMGARLRALAVEKAGTAPAGSRDIDPAAAVPAPVYSCPDCGGPMIEVDDHGLLQFRCRVGHVLSPQSMVTAEEDSVEHALWGSVRALEESAAVLRRIAAQPMIAPAAREPYLLRAQEKEEHARIIRGIMKKDSPRTVGPGRSARTPVEK